MQKEFIGWYSPTTGIYDPKRKIFRARFGAGNIKGISDIVGGWRGQLLCIEVKTSSGRQSPEQKAFEQKVTANGGLYAVIRSVDEIIDYVRALRIVSLKTLGEA